MGLLMKLLVLNTSIVICEISVILSIFLSFGCAETTKTRPSNTKPIVNAINLKNGDIVQTGFLIGTASGDDITKIEISSNGKVSLAEGTNQWIYKFPTTKEGWKDDEKRSFTIVAFDKNGNSSEKVVLNVRKGVNRDLNGDGFPDLVMGDHLFDNTKGAAFIYNGTIDGMQASIDGKKANKILKGKKSGEYFGKTIVVQDFDQDGYADIVISDFSINKHIKAYFYKGSSDGIDAPVIKTVLRDQDQSGYFGITFFVGDFSLKGFFNLFIKSRDDKKKNITVDVLEE